MVDTLDNLRLPHLRLLHLIATTTQPPPNLYMGGVAATLKWKMPDVPQEEFQRDWADLSQQGVVATYPARTMTAQGAGNLAGRLTPYGREFVRMLRLEAGHGD